MFTHQLTDHMWQLINGLKRDRQRQQAAAAKGRAINCMELEDRILLSASPIAPEALVNQNTTDVQQTATQSTQSVAADANGNHVIAWSSLNQDGSGWGVYAQRFNAAGEAQGNEFQVNTQAAQDQKEVKIAMSDNGSFVITWTDSDGDTPGSCDVYARRYDANGNPLQGQEFLVNTTTEGDQKYSSVAMTNNGFVITWSSQNQDATWDLYAQRYDSAGNMLDTEFKINAVSSEAPMAAQVGLDDWDYIVVAWQQQNGGTQDIHAIFLDPGNASWTGEFVVNTTTAGNQQNPNMGFKSNEGNCVISWTSVSADGTSDIYARRYDCWGNVLGDEFRVNTTTVGNQDHSAVAIDENTGNFIVTWSSYNQDELGDWGVYSRGYNADGTPSSQEVRVNSTTSGSQDYSSAAFLSPTDFVITWSGQGTGDSSGVFSEVCHMGLLGRYANDLSAGNPTLTNGDIGAPGQAGSMSFNGRTWTISGGGRGIGTTTDRFNYSSQDFAENGEIIAKITSLSGTGGQAGVMFRDGTASSSAFATVGLQGNTIGFVWRNSGGYPQNVVSTVAEGPVWVKLSRSGDMFSASYSYDNTNWIQLGGAQNITMNSIIKAGLAVSASNDSDIVTATFQNVSIINPRNFVLAGIDIGAPGQAGSTSFSGGVYTVTGGGSGIGGAADKYQFGANGLVGDWDLSAQILNAEAGATAGVMFRDNSAADSMFASVVLATDNTLRFEWRDSTGGTSQSISGPSVSGPVWTKLTRSGNGFTASYSTNGSDWIQIGTAQTIAMNRSVLGGLAVTSNDDAVVRSAAFANVAVSRSIAFSGTGNDIGSPAESGTSYFDNGDSYVISGSGTSIGGAADQFHFSSNNFTGDGTMVAQVNLPSSAGGSAKAGVMFRNEGTSASSFFADVVVTSANTVRFEWRDASGSNFTAINLDGHEAGDPVWVKLTRADGSFSGHYSSDGVNWTQIGENRTITMNATIQAGLAVCSGNDAALLAVNFHQVTLSQATDFAWTSTNIGNPPYSGSEWSTDGGTYVMSGGITSEGQTDQYHISSKSFSGDGSMIARIVSWTDAQSGDEAGIMFRNDASTDSSFASVVVTTGNVVTFQWKDSSGGGLESLQINGLESGNPVYVKLIRAGNQFSGYYSFDGITWSQIGETKTLQLNATVRTGLAVSAHNGTVPCTATFDHVSITQTSEINLTAADIGGPGLAGSTTCSDGVYTVIGSGNDISSTYDKFQFASESHSGDGEIIARIESLTDTQDWALSGVMFRENDSPGSRYAIVAASPDCYLQFQWRSEADGGIDCRFQNYPNSGSTFNGPIWVKLARHGNEFSAFFSEDGVHWTQFGETQAIAMSDNVQAGLAVAAANEEALNTSTFSNVSISQTSNFAWSDSEVGAPLVAGSTATPEEGYVVAGSGVDIWSNNQHFHFTSETHTGDGEIVARVDSLTNAGYWTMGGVMFRDNSAPENTNAPFAMVFATPNYSDAEGDTGGVIFQWSSANGGNPGCYRVAIPEPNLPLWVKLVRVGHEFSGYYSTNGSTWTKIGATESVGISTTAQAGLYVCPNSTTASTSAQFSHVAISQSSNFTWNDIDVGGVTTAGPGSSEYPEAGYVVAGGGPDIWGYYDSFHYDSQAVSGDLSMIAKVDSITDTGDFAKAGLMFRNDLGSDSTNAMIYVNPDNRVVFQWRSGDEGATMDTEWTHQSAGIIESPVLLKLTRMGNCFSGYYSTDDGATWIQVGSTRTIAMNETIQAGLAVSSWNNNALNTATFSEVSLTEIRHGGETGLSSVAFHRVDPMINFNWGNEGSPGPGIGGTDWSASWQGKVLADRSGTYWFAIGGDDGVRLWINDQLLIDGWELGNDYYRYGNINLTDGEWYSIRMDYRQITGDEHTSLWWAPPTQSWEMIPTSHLSIDNTAPVNQTPVTQVAVENTPLIFSTALGNAIRITDADACYGPLEVTLAVPPGAGILTLAKTEGLVFSLGDGAGDVSMTFIGSLDAINAALDGMTFTPAADYTGQFELRITTNDMAPEFAGGSKSDTDNVAINVANADGFLATYYSNSDFTGPGVQTVDPTIDFNWNGASPVAGIDGGDWSVRWTGRLEVPQTGNFSFYTTADSGCRLWINNVLVLDHLAEAGEFASAPIVLNAGQSYLVRMEYAQTGSGNQAKLEWSGDGLARQVIASDLVNHLDQAPVNHLPNDQSLQINTPLVFSTANGNAITVSDADIDAGTSSVAVNDGSFESVDVGTGYWAFDQAGVTGSPWMFMPLSWVGDLPNCSGVVGPGSAYEHDDAPQGEQVAFLQGQSAMWQELSFTESGYYSISFQAAYRESCGRNAFKVMIDGVDVGVFNPDSTNFQGFRTDPLAISAGTHRLTFQSLGNPGHQASYIDQVSVAKSESLVQVTLSVDPGTGTLSLGTLSGLVFASGDGANDETMTFSGSLASVNAALEGLQYLPVANTTGTVNLHMTTSDLMSPFPGGPKSDTDSISINVVNVSNYSGLLTTYYNWDSTAGPVYRIDPTIDVIWNADGSPAPGIVGNHWNASWEGKVLADYSETYTFHVTADDGARLWVNGVLLVDGMGNQTTNTFTGEIDLQAGQWYSIRMEYYQYNAGGTAKLEWSSASQEQGTIPTSHLSCADLLAHQNTAPVNNLPGQQGVRLNTPLTFSTASGNAISVTSPDIDESTASVAVGDGSFENSNIGTGWYSNQYNPTGSAWTFEGWSGLAANDSGVLYENGVAPNGTQVAFLQLDGSMWQDITFAESGNYTISFQAAYRVYGGASPFAVFVDGVNIGTFTPESAAFQGYQTNSFAVTAGTHRITFSHSTVADQMTFIDQVSIAKTNSIVQVNLALDPGVGTLTLSRTDGLMFLSGDGHDDASMTISGTLADINAALDGLRYMPTIDYTGPFDLHITSTHAGTIFTGGPQSASNALSVSVAVPSDTSGLLGLFYNSPGGATVDNTNLAYGKTCTTSSVLGSGYEASYAVDGNPETFSHTWDAPGEWWQVDLSPGANTELTQIKLINRNGWGYRLQGFEISVIGSDGSTVWSQTYNFPAYDGQVLTFETGKISGEYIRVRKIDNGNPDYSFLQIAEIQAFNLSVPEPDISRVDPSVNFDWGNQNPPAPGIRESNWSASWQGKILADYDETYAFHLTADDGVRLWINGELLVDSWHEQATTTHTATIAMEAGQSYSIRLDYYQIAGDSGVKLEWSSASQAREVVPNSHLNHDNAPPVNLAPGQQTTNENTPIVFSTANGNAIQVNDSDAFYGPLQVTLSVDHGTLTLSNIFNLTFISGDGTANSTMTFYGSLADINSALEGLAYMPAQSGESYISSATLQIATDDMAPALTGGSKTCTSTVAIDINAPFEYNGLQVTYFNNTDFTGTTYQRIDSTIDFNWGDAGSPAAGIEGTTWSARWLGTITTGFSEAYTFHLTGDDGFRLWVNDQLLIDKFNFNGNYTYTGTIDLVAGQAYSFRLDYRQLSSTNSIKLEWSSDSQMREVISAIHFSTLDQTPLVAVPGVQNGVGNQPIVFSENLGNAISVTELHNNGNPLTITLAASQGTITLSKLNGLTFANGDGSSDTTMTFTGSIADINAALNGLCYTRASGNSGPASLQITASDETASGGQRSSTRNVQIGAVQATAPGLLATYYSDYFLNTPAATRIDSTIDFMWNSQWGTEVAPAPGIGAQLWSAKWEGTIQAPTSETYTFYTTTDDGVRLWVNGQLLIDRWNFQGTTTYSGSISLQAGQTYSFRMEYFQHMGPNCAKLEWSTPTQARQLIPASQFSHAIQAPMNFLPASPTVNEDSSLVFSTQGGNGIRIANVDGQSNQLEVTLTAANGSFSLSRNTGLTFMAGDALNDATATFRGSLNDINAALNELVFTPDAGYHGAAGLRIDSLDLVTGLTAHNSMSIAVLAVNHPPVNHVPGTQTPNENETLTFSTAGGNAISIGDPDIEENLTPVSVGDSSFESPSLGTGGAAYQYAVLGSDWTFTGASGISANGSSLNNANAPVGSQTAFIQYGGAISQDITFAEAGSYTIGFEAAFRAGFAGANPISVEIDGVSVGVISPNSTDFQSYRTASFAISAGTHRVTFHGMNPGGDRMSFIDRVSIDKAQGLVQISLAVDIGKLNLSGTQGLVFSHGSGTNSQAMTFTGTLTDVNAALEGLQYVPLDAYEGSDTLRIASNDLGNSGAGGPKSTNSTVAINVVAVNDPPINNVPGSQGTYINHSIVFSDGNHNAISIEDQDLDPTAAAVVVNDGSFETPNVGTGFYNAFNQNVSGSAWTFTPLYYPNGPENPICSGLSGNGSGYERPNAPSGTQVAFVQGTGMIFQDIVFPKTGDYSISFLAAYRAYHTGSTAVNPILVQVDGVAVGTINPTSLNFQAFQTNAFTVTAGLHRVSFSGTVSQRDVTSYIDQVAIAPANDVASQVQVSLAVEHGILTLSSTQGLTYISGDGAADATMTFQGTLANINAALNGLRYDPITGYVGADNIQIITNDLGNSGEGGALSTTSMVAINVAGGPVVNSTTEGIQQTFAESPQAVAADKNGNYVVVWSSENQDGDGWGVYARQFNAAGIAQGEEFRVNTNTTGDQKYATVAMSADGRFVVTWTGSNQDGSGQGIYGQRFDASGNAIGSEFQVNTTTASDQMYSCVAINANGDFAVTWSSLDTDTNNWNVFARIFRADGSQTAEFQVNVESSGDQKFSRIAMNEAGAFAIVWQSRVPDGNWDIYARTYDANGVAQGNEFRVNDTATGDQSNASIAMSADSRFVISWTGDGQDGGGTGIYARHFNADGATDRVYTVSGSGSDIWFGSDNFHYASEEISGNATMIANVDTTTDTGDWAKSGLMFRDDLNPDSMHAMIYVNPENQVVFQWRITDGADANDTNHVLGVPLSIESRVWLKLTRVGNDFAGYYSIDGVAWIQVGSTKTIAMSQNYQAGLAVTAWNASALCTATFKHVSINQDTDLDLVGRDIGTVNLAGSTTYGGEFRVNTTTDGNQDYSSVAMDRRGNFFITWSSLGQDTPDVWSIYGRRYYDDGTSPGVEFRINGNTENSQQFSSVTSLSPRNYLVVWSGNAPGDTTGVFQAEQCPRGLLASYFNNGDFSGTPVQRIDSSVNFDYGYRGTPIEGFNVDHWSARWEGMIRANTTETYTFYVNTAGTAQLWINGELVIDAGDSGTVSLVAGQWYSIRLDYYEPEGWRDAMLQWSSNSISKQLVPSSQLTYENPAPVNHLPTSQNTNEDTPLVFSTAGGNALQISDLDVGNDPMEVTLSVSQGKISLGRLAGLTLLEGDGIDDVLMTFRGTMADINAALDGLTFTAPANFNGVIELQISTNDLGSTGVGGAKTSTSTLAINVVAVNDPSVITLPGPQGVIEHQTLLLSQVTGNAIRISDLDAGNNPIQVTISTDHGRLTLSSTVGLTLTGGNGEDASSITMTGTIGSINAALDGLQFRPDDNYGGIATLQVTVNDLGNTGIGGPSIVANSLAIAVTAVNDAPMIVMPLGQNAFTQYAKVFSSQAGNAIRIEDPDAGNSIIRVVLTVDEGTVSLSRLDGLTLRSGFGTNDTEIIMEGTLADINAALEGMQYKARSGFEGTVQLSVGVNDFGNTGIGGQKTDTRTMTINVARANEPPVNSIPGPQNVLEHHAVTFYSIYGNGIRISDPDAGNYPLQVTLTADHGTLTLGGTQGLTFLAGNGVNNRTMTFTGTTASINAALEGLRFAPVNNYDGLAALHIHTDDLGYTGAGGPQTADSTIAIHVTAINDPATIGIPGYQSVLEHQKLTFSPAGGNAIIIGDGDEGNGLVEVTLTVDAGRLSLGGVAGLTFASSSGPEGATMKFTGSVADVNQALDGLQFMPIDNYDGLANLQIRVNDLGNSGIGGPKITLRNVTIGVTAVNDPPEFTLPKTESLGYDLTQITFSAANGNGIGVSDPENGNNPVRLTITVTDGSFSLGRTEGLSILGGTPTQSTFIIIYGSSSSVTNALDGMVFKTNLPSAKMTLFAEDLSTTSGIGGPQSKIAVVCADRTVEPMSFSGGNSAFFQPVSGVLTMPVATAAQDLPYNAQFQAKLPTLEGDLVSAPLFTTNTMQNVNTRFADAATTDSSYDRTMNRGNGKNQEDFVDVRDAKVLEDNKFSPETQIMAEPVQLGSSMGRDENILVGLGIVSAGYLAWAFNGGSLLAGAISATPMWKPFDPLAVLDFNDRASRSGLLPLDGETGMVGDDNLQSLLG